MVSYSGVASQELGVRWPSFGTCSDLQRTTMKWENKVSSRFLLGFFCGEILDYAIETTIYEYSSCFVFPP